MTDFRSGWGLVILVLAGLVIIVDAAVAMFRLSRSRRSTEVFWERRYAHAAHWCEFPLCDERAPAYVQFPLHPGTVTPLTSGYYCQLHAHHLQSVVYFATSTKADPK